MWASARFWCRSSISRDARCYHRQSPFAMIAGMFVAAMAYTYLQVAQVPLSLPDVDQKTYAEAFPLRWRVL